MRVAPASTCADATFEAGVVVRDLGDQRRFERRIELANAWINWRAGPSVPTYGFMTPRDHIDYLDPIHHLAMRLRMAPAPRETLIDLPRARWREVRGFDGEAPFSLDIHRRPARGICKSARLSFSIASHTSI